MKHVLIFFLMISHILVNGVAASIHTTEDYEHGHEVEHQHFLSGEQQVQNDDWQHDHDDCAHANHQFQVFDSIQILHSRQVTQIQSEIIWRISSTTITPPVPPPTY